MAYHELVRLEHNLAVRDVTLTHPAALLLLCTSPRYLGATPASRGSAEVRRMAAAAKSQAHIPHSEDQLRALLGVQSHSLLNDDHAGTEEGAYDSDALYGVEVEGKELEERQHTGPEEGEAEGEEEEEEEGTVPVDDWMKFRMAPPEADAIHTLRILLQGAFYRQVKSL